MTNNKGDSMCQELNGVVKQELSVHRASCVEIEVHCSFNVPFL